MCLQVKWPFQAKVATEDIVCYKILEQHTYSDGDIQIVTPYQKTEVDKDILSGKKPMISCHGYYDKNADWNEAELTEDIFKKLIDMAVCGDTIGPGAIHTISSITNARAERGWFRVRNRNFKYLIYKCVIPKGTLYYEGKYAGNIRSYASNQLVFKEEVLD